MSSHRSSAPTLPRTSYTKQPIFIEDPVTGDDSSYGSDATSMHSNPINYSTIKKNNSNALNREVRFIPKFFEFPLVEKKHKVNIRINFALSLSPRKLHSP